MKVSIVIATLNRCEELLRTLQAYQQQTYPNKEIIVVDNGSTDETPQAVPRDFPEVRYVWIPNNIETVAINYGMSLATGDVFWLTNNDSYPADPSALEQIVRIFQRFPEIDIIGTEDYEVRDQAVYDWYGKAVSKDQMPPDGYPAVRFHGTGAAIRRQVVERIGGFWDRFVYEELDFSIRALRAGFRIRYFPTIRVLHFASPRSRGRAFRWQRAYLHTLRLLWKYLPLPIATGRTIVTAVFFIVAALRNAIRPDLVLETYLESFPLILRTCRSERQPLTMSQVRTYELSIGRIRDYWDYVHHVWKRRKKQR